MSFRKNVFILGAGFSHAAGAPLMDEFLSYARDLRDDPKSELDNHDRQVFDRVIQYRYGLNSALAKVVVDLDNIEELFGFMEMDLQLCIQSDGFQAANVGRDDMTYLIARTLEISIGRPLPQFGQAFETKPIGNEFKKWIYAHNKYSFFLGLVSGLWNPEKRVDIVAKDSIITFNYDLVLEREMLGLKLAPEYHCGTSATPYREAFGGHKAQINILKMHGSANWVMCHKCESGRLHFLDSETAIVSNVQSLSCPQCDQAGLSQIIVPPTWNKGIEGKFLRSVWSKALQEMMTAERLFIIGYSFPKTDQFFKYMLGLALARNNLLSEVYIVNPNEAVEKRFETLFHQYFRQRVVKVRRNDTDWFIETYLTLTHQKFEEKDLGDSFGMQSVWKLYPDGSAQQKG